MKDIRIARRGLLGAPLAAWAQAPSGDLPRNASAASSELHEAIAAFGARHERNLVRSLGLAPTARVLDLGCGRGDHVLLFAEALGEGGRVTGLDRRRDSLDFAAARLERAGLAGRAKLDEGDLFAMPYEPGSFDLVWSSHVFHGLRELPAAAAAVRRVVRRGGRFALRENRVSATLLPSDIGIGEPGLEARLNFAFDAWLRRDRRELGRYPHGWQRLLADAGFVEVVAQAYLHEARPPFDELQQRYLRYWLDRKRNIEGATPEDIATLDRLVDPGDEAYFLHRDDLHFVAVSTVYTGVAA